MKKITPFLWFENNAEEAINYYTTTFKNSRITSISRYGAGALYPEGTLFIASLELEGQELTVINGGPYFKFTEAISFFVNCESQEEVDYLWDRLSDGGEKSRCGWLKDRFGLSWQIVPTRLGELMGSPDPIKSQRVMEAMLKMDKLDIQTLQDAHDRD